jgi:hypothetical protein
MDAFLRSLPGGSPAPADIDGRDDSETLTRDAVGPSARFLGASAP